MTWLVLILIGLVAGLASGLVGIGGGIIIIPSLIMISGYNQKLARGTALALMIPPIGIFVALGILQARIRKYIHRHFHSSRVYDWRIFWRQISDRSVRHNRHQGVRNIFITDSPKTINLPRQIMLTSPRDQLYSVNVNNLQ